MGKVTFDPLQKIIIDEFRKDPLLRDYFYFTGGTALSIFYFQHRLSEDLDFFTEKKVPYDQVVSFISKAAKKHHFKPVLPQPTL